MSGQTWLRRGGESAFNSLNRRASLYPRDVVGTGKGKATLLFGDGSQIRLNANSAVEITEPKKSGGKTNLFRALSGTLWARLRPDKGGQTRYSNLAVRGTEFQLEVAEDGTSTLTVLEGAVAFWNEKGEVLVPAGQQSTVRPNQAPTAPIAVANPGLIVEWTFELERAEIRREKLPDVEGVSTPSQVEQAWAELERNSPATAQTFAEQAIAANANSAEAQIVHGVALLRQSKLDDAERALESALKNNDKRYIYQAHAWLALVHLARNQREAALDEAKTATQTAPNSALARSHYALVLFFNGDIEQAEREARSALKLDPDSVASRVTLAQVLLASGDVNEAARMAAQAAALDPQNAFAQYTLGVADAARRDYRHATQSLQQSVKLAPEFLPASAALARVRLRAGNESTALRELETLASRETQSHQVQAALGEVLYERGQFDRAIEQFGKATQLNPNSALYFAQLSRVLLDANRLNDAILAGQEAVRLAPQVGEYHAILGRAYDFSNLRAQAEREYRTAITLDPQNALARAFLSLHHSGIDLRLGGAELAQSFLYDPAISEQLTRGGIDTELTAFAGTRSRYGGEVLHKGKFNDGSAHYFTRLRRDGDDGDREEDAQLEFPLNADSTGTDALLTGTFVPNPGTHLFGYISGKRVRRGVPGPQINDFGMIVDGTQSRQTVRDIEGALALRQQVGSRGHLWTSLRADRLRNAITIDEEASPLQLQLGTSPSYVADVRLDWTFDRSPQRSKVLTVGVSRAALDYDSKIIVDPNGPPNGGLIGRGLTASEGSSWLVYGQWSQRVNERFSLIAQLRRLHLESESNIDTFFGPEFVEEKREETLPSLIATYLAGKRTTLRLSASRRATELQTSTLAPNETLLATEPGVLPRGVPRIFDVAQFDYERYLGGNGFLKLYAFHAKSDRVRYGGDGFTGGFADPVNSLPGSLPASFSQTIDVTDWRSTGIGARYEQPITRRLFGNAGVVLRDVENNTPPAFFGRDESPYEPERLAFLGLDYLGGRGTKINLRLRHEGSYIQMRDRFDDVNEFGSETYVDLRIAREPSVRHEYFLNINNLFDNRELLFEGYPTNRRQVTVGYTRRF